MIFFAFLSLLFIMIFVSKLKTYTITFSEFQASDCCDLVHHDIWGPYHYKTSFGSSYFLTLV